MKRLINDAGLEKPSANFSANVMKAIAVKKVVREYEPLISKRGWLVLSVSLFLTVVGLYFFNSGYQIKIDFSYFNNISIPTIELSRTMSYAIGFIALFFLQIPFLKSLMEKQVKY